MKSRRWAFRCLLVLLTVAVIAGGGEGLVRLVAPQDLSGTWREPGPRGLVLNRAGGTARHSFGDHRVTYRFNRLHQRGRPMGGRSVPVLVLGDSFTFGWLIAEHESFVGRLQTKANRVFGHEAIRLLNAGTGGWGTAHSLAYLEHFGSVIRPRGVIMFVNWDDLTRSQKYPLYGLTPDGGLELEARSIEIPGEGLREALFGLVPGYGWLLEHSHLIQILRNLVARLIEPERPDARRPPPRPTTAKTTTGATAASVAAAPAQGDLLARALFHRLRLWCERNRAKLLVVTTGWPMGDYGWAVRAAAAEGIALLDLRPTMGATILPHLTKYHLADGHPNAAGHASIADAAWPWLEPKLADLRRRRR